jgi:pyruvate formate-lyase/glycerol dehydratase family glycyl radical enzyme
MVTGSITRKAVDEEAVKKVNVLTERVKKRIREWEEAKPLVDAQTSVSFTKSWKETEGLHLDLRWAKAFQTIMKESAIVIRDGELIVGSPNKYVKGVYLFVAADPVEYLRQLEKRNLQRQSSDTRGGELDAAEEKLLLEDARYWVEHLPPENEYNSMREELGEEYLDILEGGGKDPTLDVGATVIESAPLRRGLRFGFPHNDFEFDVRLLNRGLKGCIARARAEQEKMDKLGYGLPAPSTVAYDKHVLLKSVIMSCEAIIDFARRHAKLARSMAKKESNPVRKRELEKIAEVCDWVPENPPRDFWEAVQFASFIHLAKAKETANSGSAIGRLDQYLYPWYEKDVINEGKLSRQEAAELLGCFWMKRRECDPSTNLGWEDHPSLGALLAQVTLCGRDAKGRDETNELSWLILEVMRQMKLSEPSVYVRYHEGMSREFLRHAVECNRDFGGGNPAFFNDELGTARLLARGAVLEDAVNWNATGCVAYNMTATDMHGGGDLHINGAKVFELALHNGFDQRTGKQIGLKTGDVTKFTSIEEFIQALEKQYAYFADLMRKDYFVRKSVRNTLIPNSGIACAVIEDCIEKGLGPGRGGERYGVTSQHWISDRGITDIADSLTAIKYLVFDKKQTTMVELMEALKADFEGYEDLRQACLKAPKYGNDDDYADDMFNEVSLRTQKILLSQPDPFTGFKPFIFKGAGAGHVLQGRVVGALPNGRKAWTSINDAFSSAMAGMDVNGPTALINSATKVDHAWECIGITHNMKFDKALLNTPEKLDRIIDLIKTFFDRGGWHIQFNIVSADELIDARKHPEKWRHLVVRVAGFSAYFVDLPLKVQDEIIARTLHGV